MTPPNNNEIRAQRLIEIRALIHPFYTGRIRLFFTSVATKLTGACISGLGIYLHSIPLSLLGILIWLSWFVMISGVALPGTDDFLKKRLRWLRSAAVIITIIILAIGLLWGVTVASLNSRYAKENILIHYSQNIADSLAEIFAYNDATALNQQAGENILKGLNPYAEANVVTASITYNVPGIQITPLRRGIFANIFPYPDLNGLDSFWQDAKKHPTVIPVEVESNYSYPAGSFLILAPFLLVGIQDIRIVFAFFLIVPIAILIWRTRGEGRIVLTLAILVSLELFSLVAFGDTGVMQFPFLLFGWILWKKHWLASAILMGIAISIKQVSWAYALFYMVLIFREMGLRKLLKTSGILGGIFVSCNLPFIIVNPVLWTSSMLAIVTDPMFPMGAGFVSVMTTGPVVIKSSLVFDMAALVILIIGLVWYYRNCRSFPYMGPILAILPFFFAWRSMWGYFFFADYIVLACIVTHEYSSRMIPLEPAIHIS